MIPIMLTESPSLLATIEQAKKAAKSTHPILITGETGTGKELMARLIHASSGDSGPFVALNCASIADELLQAELFGAKKGSYTGALHDKAGKLAAASGGTLLLDEIGDASPRFQAALLRVLDSGEYYPVGSNDLHHSSARILAATNKPDALRRDLYYRLSAVEVEIPPLRARPEDIALLWRHFSGFDIVNHDDRDRIMAHSWPGNVRELQAAARHYRDTFELPAHIGPDGTLPLTLRQQADVTMLEELEDTPQAAAAQVLGISERTIREKLNALRKRYPLGESMRRIELEAIRDAIKETGSKQGAARLLGINRTTLIEKLKRPANG